MCTVPYYDKRLSDPACYAQTGIRNGKKALSSTGLNIGYFFLQNLMGGLKLKDFFMVEADRTVDLGLYEEKVYKNGRTARIKSKGILKQRIIITFSRKMMEYQGRIRSRQVERAKRLLAIKDPEETKKNRMT